MHQKKRLFDSIKLDIPAEEPVNNLLMPLKNKRDSQGSRVGHAGIKLANLEQGSIESNSFVQAYPKSFLTQFETQNLKSSQKEDATPEKATLTTNATNMRIYLDKTGDVSI